MMRSVWQGIVVALAGLLACGGCQPKPAGPRIEGLGWRDWQPMESVEYRIEMQQLGEVPNSGLLLPAASPDGRWVACLQTPPSSQLDSQSLLSGQGCQDNCLLLRAAGPGGSFRSVCDAGATWTAWSQDSTKLIFIACGQGGRGELGVHDVASATTRRLALGMKRVGMPAVSPAGDKIAVVDADPLPASSQIYVLELDGGRLQPGPPLQDGSRQLWPIWVDDHTILFLDWGSKESWLREWTVGSLEVRPVRQLPHLPWTDEVMQLFVAIARPLRADGGSLVCYDASQDRLVTIDLSGGGRGLQPPHTRAGCWMGKGLLSASDKDLYLSAGQATGGPNRLLKGTWLPIWADEQTGQVILCGRGKDDRTFAMLRVRLLRRGTDLPPSPAPSQPVRRP